LVSFKSNAAAERHAKFLHPKKSMFKQKPSKKFNIIFSLIEKANVPNTFKCGVCGNVYPSYWYLQKHKKEMGHKQPGKGRPKK
jgi:hypothetical protein